MLYREGTAYTQVATKSALFLFFKNKTTHKTRLNTVIITGVKYAFINDGTADESFFKSRMI
jgi:hypothetical protein